MELVSANKMRELANHVKSEIPTGLGFCIIIFPMDTSDGIYNYISNAERESMVKALRIKADQLESGMPFKTPEGN